MNSKQPIKKTLQFTLTESAAVFKKNPHIWFTTDTFVCTCVINGGFVATSVTRMGTKRIKPCLTCTERVAHKATRYEHKLKTPSDILFRGFVFS